MARSRAFVCMALLLGSGSCGENAMQSDRSAGARQCSDVGSFPDLVWIPGGDFVMGEDPRYPEEGPPRSVSINGFWISRHEVTNAQFARFVEETGYVTLAEKEPPQFVDIPDEMREPGSAVFNIPTQADPRWWRWVLGAQWRRPKGKDVRVDRQGQKPVVQIAYDDALAYADWAGLELPTEAQWEYAARAGQEAIAEPRNENGAPTANFYQGVFPAKDTGDDGFTTRSPVGCYPANAFGLRDMVGNVWEWTTTRATRGNVSEEVLTIKGGSYLCAANYCARYRPAARQFQERGLGTDHIGFRVVDNRRPKPQR